MLFYPIPPTRNQDIGNAYYGPVFPPEACERVLASLEASKWEPGLVGSADPDAGFDQRAEVRSCEQQTLPLARDGFPLDLMAQAVAAVNAEMWSFELNGFVADDPPWVMKYTAQQHGHYDWHVDVGRMSAASRKLGISIQLSHADEYEGGNLEFHGHDADREVLRARGAMALFPAYWPHRVTPVTEGTRIALVGWVHGPSFR